MSDPPFQPAPEIIQVAWMAYHSGNTDRIDLLRRISSLAADRTVNDAVAIVLLCHAASRSMRRSSCEATHPHRTGPPDGGRYHHFVHQAAPSSGSDGGVGLLRA